MIAVIQIEREKWKNNDERIGDLCGSIKLNEASSFIKYLKTRRKKAQENAFDVITANDSPNVGTDMYIHGQEV